MKKILTLAAAVAVTMGTASLSFAGKLEKQDANKDGVLTMDEFKGKDEVFKKLDTNKDGKLTEDELTAGRMNKNKKNWIKGDKGRKNQPKDPDTFFKNRDKNSDGKLDKTEFPGKNFDKIDKNGDGALTPDEVKAMPKFMTPEERKEFHKNQWFDNHDANGDGYLSREEFYGKNGDPFSRLDQNGDGKLSQDEAASRFQRRQNKNHQKGQGKHLRKHEGKSAK